MVFVVVQHPLRAHEVERCSEPLPCFACVVLYLVKQRIIGHDASVSPQTRPHCCSSLATSSNNMFFTEAGLLPETVTSLTPSRLSDSTCTVLGLSRRSRTPCLRCGLIAEYVAVVR